MGDGLQIHRTRYHRSYSVAYAYGFAKHVVAVLNTVRTNNGCVSLADPNGMLTMLVVPEFGKENTPH